jgi:hypothetical protein
MNACTHTHTHDYIPTSSSARALTHMHTHNHTHKHTRQKTKPSPAIIREKFCLKPSSCCVSTGALLTVSVALDSEAYTVEAFLTGQAICAVDSMYACTSRAASVAQPPSCGALRHVGDMPVVKQRTQQDSRRENSLPPKRQEQQNKTYLAGVRDVAGN